MKIHRISAAFVCLASAALAACENGVAPVGPPEGLLVVGSSELAVVAGVPDTESLAVKVVDESGRGVSGVEVTWSTTAGVTLTPLTTTTDGSGVARTDARAGTVAGTGHVRASVATSGGTLTAAFEVTVVAGPATALTGPDTLVVARGGTQAMPVTATDAYGNVASLAGATWTSSNPAAADVSATGTVTAGGLGGTVVQVTVGSAVWQTQLWVVPATLTECETNTAQVCGTWTLTDGRYVGVWSQGTVADIFVRRWDGTEVAFRRTDTAGPSMGLTVEYTGTVQGTAVNNGTVAWTRFGDTYTGSWTATW